MNFRVGAVVFSNNEVLGQGFNFFSCWNESNRRVSVHAEMHSISGLRHDVVRNTEMVVVRINKRNEPKNCNPCPKCMKMLARKGIRKVYCPQENGDIKVFYP